MTKKEYYQRYYSKNSERIKKQVRAWQGANPERVQEHQKRYRTKHADEIKDYMKSWRKANKSKLKEYNSNYWRRKEG